MSNEIGYDMADNFYRRLVDCGNGYSVSIVSVIGSYGHDLGLFECVAVWNRTGCMVSPLGFDAEPDVAGYLDFDGVADYVAHVRGIVPTDRPVVADCDSVYL